MKKKTVIIAVATAIVLAIPTVAWALNGPLGADPQTPTAPGQWPANDWHGGMGHMHNAMWNDGDLPEDCPAEAAGWMSQMHDHMWGSTHDHGSHGAVGHMHDGGTWNGPMGGGRWDGR